MPDQILGTASLESTNPDPQLLVSTDSVFLASVVFGVDKEKLAKCYLAVVGVWS